MSRNIPKTRAEKVALAQPPATQPEEELDRADPEHFTKSELLTMMAQEEGEEIVSDILNELITHAMERSYELYIKKQILPFTVAWTKTTILNMVKWQYLMCDEGDDLNTNSLLQEDTAPAPSLPDSWAEGCVPVIKSSNHLQEVKIDTQEAAIKDLQKIQVALSIDKPESPPRKPRGNGRTMKVIPAPHAKIEVERKPHPPETSPNNLKLPETQNILQH